LTLKNYIVTELSREQHNPNYMNSWERVSLYRPCKTKYY